MGSVRFEVIKKNGQEVVEEIHKIVVHKFSVGDVEDPDLYAAQPLWEWEKSNSGQFIMKHAIQKPEWQRFSDPLTLSYRYVIQAELEKSKLSEFYLRWGKP